MMAQIILFIASGFGQLTYDCKETQSYGSVSVHKEDAAGDDKAYLSHKSCDYE